MTMKDFVTAMKAAHLEFSLEVLMYLDDAKAATTAIAYWKPKANHINKRLDDDSAKLLQSKYQKQLDKAREQFDKALNQGLAIALWEKQHGKMIELVQDEWSLSDTNMFNQLVDRWRAILLKFGIEIDEF